jgi:nitrate reductase / nitrite oxidoreductase, beta subunit
MTPDGIERAASTEDEKDLYEAQLRLFLDPNDPTIAAQARADGVPDAWIEAAKRSPTYKMAVDWKIAFPLHPEYRTLPMVWYVPPLSPIQSHASAGAIETVGEIPDVRSLRIPVRYLANLLTAGAEAPIVTALERMLAMRVYFRQRQLGEGDGRSVLSQAGLGAQYSPSCHCLSAAQDLPNLVRVQIVIASLANELARILAVQDQFCSLEHRGRRRRIG